MKILIATHGHLADGVKDNLSLFIDVADVEVINAYADGDEADWLDDVDSFIKGCGEDEIRVIFTDIMGGSVNQKILEHDKPSNVKVIAGFNIALILEVYLSGLKTDEEIEKAIEGARAQMQLCKLEKVAEVDEDDFLS